MTATAIPLDHTLTLVSDTAINIYRFNASGQVAATIGTKNGPVCGPLFSWRVLSADCIEIADSDGHTDRWTNIRVERDLLHAECNGLARTFTIRKPSQ
ncbi:MULTISPECIES: hypothetical protein [unclassified Variovorax]|jgi:hypothetical protein|uniref:hypothetical protein n=1 Tax=unclassified Variovorax TaxID=663243 RepID=UPI000F7D8D26|nr:MULTISPECIES: hypothetical protein [unclassified Variovorax]RSZ30678.1 hypothetical protein EJO70_32525 [Variovorax sp. 553]RSZ31213.1 hypothetical protein EJO71_32240 [Variovorax sp. 679]